MVTPPVAALSQSGPRFDDRALTRSAVTSPPVPGYERQQEPHPVRRCQRCGRGFRGTRRGRERADRQSEPASATHSAHRSEVVGVVLVGVCRPRPNSVLAACYLVGSTAPLRGAICLLRDTSHVTPNAVAVPATAQESAVDTQAPVPYDFTIVTSPSSSWYVQLMPGGQITRLDVYDGSVSAKRSRSSTKHFCLACWSAGAMR